jgi:hypothetical protein
VVQDVFVSLARSAETFRLRGNLRSYLATCVVNRARDRMRARKRRGPVVSLEDSAPLVSEAAPDGRLPANERSRQVARVAALKPWLVAEETTLVGRHLAWTQKGDKCYEWGIYVAGGTVPERGTFQDRKAVCEYRDAEPRWFRSAPNSISLELTIASETAFEAWVVQAMAVLSDDGKAPEHVTYAGVLRLAGEIRQSLAR